MLKKLIIFVVASALLLTACGPEPPPDRVDSGSDAEADAGDVEEDVNPGDTVDDTTDASDAEEDAGDAEDTQEDVDSCTPKTTCSSDECGTVDDGCGGTLECGECPECESAADCEAGANVNASCDNGSCAFACETDFVDIDGDLGSNGNGCECGISNGGTEICDGEDNDCDGTVDNNPEPQNCAKTDGVCAGVKTSSCDGDSYAACTASDYGADYVNSADEGLRCDGEDNNCDGTVDNPCCGSAGNATFPAPSILGNGFEPGPDFPYDTPVEPVIAPVAQGAPSQAVATVAYASASDTVTVTHINDSGNPFGQTYIRTENDLYTDVELVRTAKGYDLIFARTIREANLGGFSAIEVQQLTPSLTEDGSDAQLVYVNNDTLAQVYRALDASYYDRSVVVGASSYAGFGEPSEAFFYRIDSIDSTSKSISIDGNEEGISPATVTVSNGNLLVVTDESDDEVYGQALDQNGSPIGSLNHSTPISANPLLLSWTGGNEVAAVYESGGALSAATLNYSTPASPSPGSINSGSALGEFIAKTDWDDDQNGDAESTTLVWRASGGTELMAAEYDLSSGTLLSGPTAVLNNAGNINDVSITNDGDQALVVYQDRTGGSQVKLFRISRSGTALCN